MGRTLVATVCGEQAVMQVLDFVEQNLSFGAHGDIETALVELAERASRCYNVQGAKLTLQTDDSNRALHLVDYGITAYKGVMSIVKSKAELVGKLYRNALTYGKPLPFGEVRELKALLSTIGLNDSTEYMVFRVGLNYLAGLDSKGQPIYGPFARAYTVGTKIMRYVYEGVLESTGLEFTEEPAFEEGSSAPEMEITQEETRSAIQALDPRYQGELDKIVHKQEGLIGKYGGTPGQRKYGTQDQAVWDNLQRRQEELTGTGSYASSTPVVSDKKGKGSTTGIKRMSLS